MLFQKTVLNERYEIKSAIGSGGMGQVYLALDKRLGNAVAVKQQSLPAEVDSLNSKKEAQELESQLRKAFEREAKLLSRLRHPALPHVTDYFKQDGSYFLVMDYIKGEDFWQMLHKGKQFSAEEILNFAMQLCDVIEYLHTSQEEPVIHRDIKPHNIKLNERGHIVLLDFGNAKASLEYITVVSKGMSVFAVTPEYAPLEQIIRLSDDQWKVFLGNLNPTKLANILQAKTDTRSDIFSLSVTLYHLLAGQVPPNSVVRAASVWAGKDDPVREIHAINSNVNADVSHVLHKAMSLEPEYRHQSIKGFRNDLIEARKGNRISYYDAAEPAPYYRVQDGPSGVEKDNSRKWDEEVRLLHEALAAQNGADKKADVGLNNDEDEFISMPEPDRLSTPDETKPWFIARHQIEQDNLGITTPNFKQQQKVRSSTTEPQKKIKLKTPIKLRIDKSNSKLPNKMPKVNLPKRNIKKLGLLVIGIIVILCAIISGAWLALTRMGNKSVEKKQTQGNINPPQPAPKIYSPSNSRQKNLSFGQTRTSDAKQTIDIDAVLSHHKI